MEEVSIDIMLRISGLELLTNAGIKTQTASLDMHSVNGLTPYRPSGS